MIGALIFIVALGVILGGLINGRGRFTGYGAFIAMGALVGSGLALAVNAL